MGNNIYVFSIGITILLVILTWVINWYFFYYVGNFYFKVDNCSFIVRLNRKGTYLLNATLNSKNTEKIKFVVEEGSYTFSKNIVQITTEKTLVTEFSNIKSILENNKENEVQRFRENTILTKPLKAREHKLYCNEIFLNKIKKSKLVNIKEYAK
ncbi:hypothetical protein [Liquorilactobacillus satsumensis]|uniref:Uncharacterized protein n=1 Tax=Liquorilactobacillus satsumensis DSM 16230 = JCM 12392 TaxID=1423801 RepID=A0A0R1V074_9LACO|nr:hypothetical protein [Liquorilactobacillus satsumensis]KRL99020.1 hypothetical protein FD50_GL000290 [Liquorilactobacillus satsumensis DSM 16230 = JCM 12392]